MIPKFTNPHSLSLGFETTTRAEHVEQTGIAASVVHNGNTDSLKRTLDALLRDMWIDGLTQGPGSCPRLKKRRKTQENPEHDDDKLGSTVFRLISSMKHPQYISLVPKPPPPPKTKEPDCEDSAAQAEERMKRARSVAVEFDRQWNVYAPHANTLSLPTLLVIEESRAMKQHPAYLRQFKDQDSQLCSGPAPSPHEPRTSCVILPVQSALDRDETTRGKHRKRAKERPSPAYWRPPPALRGKCMGYALGYPGSWLPPGDEPKNQWYSRDVMKKAVRPALVS
ncbi:hypothetical protein PAXRUDRAFT_139399 [Paxillus rubicundulus Ve08.2h10]|uniref:Uncharacterized protein n=1 Tax=Paxillus rubicundulus Ve08.2h10 TaxID=930991 RepID=A0A0D0E9T2_9AGAM|nr:hypothetical protein PAXRUDRAFT_139399 [Paxillus rubicundulus Ve08.2h10]